MTLEEAQEIVIAGAHGAGVVCPCCKQFAKVYRRTVTSAMARALIEFYWIDDRDKGKWVHVTRNKWIGMKTRDHSVLAHWGLVEERWGRSDEGGRCTGYWRITKKGIDFAKGDISLPKYVYIYNGELVDTDSSEKITIEDALKNKFNYRELMAR